MKPRVAITGASGFIGRHVLRSMLDKNIPVVAITRRPEQMREFEDRTKIAVVDLAGSTDLAVEQVGRPDILIHLAWSGLPNYRSLHHFETELPRQYSFLRAMVDGGLRTLLVAGTCFEYGMQNGELAEECPSQPETPYAFAKDALRRQLLHLKSRRGFNLNWCRIFYLYGPGQGEKSLWPQLNRALDRGDPVFPMSGGEQLRDFLSVAKVAEALTSVALAERDLGILNICSGRPRSVRSMVEEWVADRGGAIELGLGALPYADYEPMAFWGSCAKLESVLRCQ